MRSTTTFPSEDRRSGLLPRLTAPAAALAWLVTAAAAAPGQAPAPEPVGVPDEALRKVRLAAGYVGAPRALEDDGTLLASATEGAIEERSLSVFDVVHVTPRFEGRDAAPGDTLLVYRDDGELRHPVTNEPLGRIVHPTGLLAVTAAEADVASAVIVEGFEPIVAGQRVQHVRRGADPLPAGERIAGEGLVVGFRDPAAIVEPYAVVFLDLPAGLDLHAGDVVELFRTERAEGRELPEAEIGTARVLDVGVGAATALVLSLARSDLQVGDRYRRVAEVRE